MPEIFNLDCKGKLSLKSTIQMKIFLIGIHQTVDPLLSFFISDQLSPTSDLIRNERYQNKQYQTLVHFQSSRGRRGEKAGRSVKWESFWEGVITLFDVLVKIVYVANNYRQKQFWLFLLILPT